MSISSSILFFRIFSSPNVIPRISLSKTLKFPTSSQSLAFFRRSITFQSLSSESQSSQLSSSSSSVSIGPNSIEFAPLPPKLQEIINLFQSVPDPKSKYQQLLFYGKNLTPLDVRFKTTENKVQGCVSQVWVRAYLDEGRNVVFEADSDSVLTKGLAALLVQGLSGRPVEEVLKVSPDFVKLLGLQQSLTPSRNNGFFNMLKLMQKKALQLYVEAEKANELEKQVVKSIERGINISASGETFSSSSEIDTELNSEFVSAETLSVMSQTGGTGTTDGSLGSRGLRIKESLERKLNPSKIEIVDVSYQHAGHAGVRGSNGETHFNVKIVSQEFEGKSLVKRHRLIYSLLNEELQSGLHALSIDAKTPSEVNGGSFAKISSGVVEKLCFVGGDIIVARGKSKHFCRNAEKETSSQEDCVGNGGAG